jgi:hypothetical protein
MGMGTVPIQARVSTRASRSIDEVQPPARVAAYPLGRILLQLEKKDSSTSMAPSVGALSGRSDIRHK